MATTARRRLLNDLKKMKSQPPEGIEAAPDDNDIYSWDAVIYGPNNTIWEGGIFVLKINFTEDYPNQAPNVVFKSKMFHPNIYDNGNICLDILNNKWSPTYDTSMILISIQSLLCDPNTDSPANVPASKLFNSDQKAYNKRV